jgi:hypothetical protein
LFITAQADWNDHQLEFVDQARIHQTRDKSCSADSVHIFARLLFQSSNFVYVSNDPSSTPLQIVESGLRSMVRKGRYAGTGFREGAPRSHQARCRDGRRRKSSQHCAA